MKKSIIICGIVWLWAGPLSLAQAAPSVGYVYPAGGQRGKTLVVTVGGQGLRNITSAKISGKGVSVKVGDYQQILSRGQAGQLKRHLRSKLYWEKRAKNPKAKKRKGKEPDKFDKVRYDRLIKRAGLTGMDIPELQAYMKLIKNPKAQPNKQLADQRKLEITISPNAPLGVRELFLVGPRGSSNVLRFDVAQYDEIRELAADRSITDTVSVKSVPVVLNGQILPGDIDRFRFQAKAGTSLVAAVQARSLVPYLADAVPGWFQATLTLTDANGKEIAFCDDNEFDPDPVLMCTIPADGEYELQIADSIYRGREDFVYRITLGEVPYVTSIFPMGGRQGRRTAVQPTGVNLGKARAKGIAPGKPGQIHSIRFKGAGGKQSNPVSFLSTDLRDVIEGKGNKSVRWPASIHGRMDKPGDVDQYLFKAKKGDSLVAEVFARRLGSPLDSLLMIQDAQGAVVASNDDWEDPASGLITHHADSRLMFTAPADGMYTLRIADTQHRGGEAYGYLLQLRKRSPGFELRVMPAGQVCRPNGRTIVTVCALRTDGFEETIRLALVGAPKGTVLEGGTIPARIDRVRVTIRAVTRGKKKNYPLSKPFGLSGSVTIDGRPYVRRAQGAEDQMQAFLWRHWVCVDGAGLQVGGRRAWAFPLRPETSKAIAIPSGGSVRVKFVGLRRKEIDKYTYPLNQPPPGISVKQIEIDEEDEGAVFEFSADGVQAKADLAGNLIMNVISKLTIDPKTKKKRGGWTQGTLRAIPFYVVRGKSPVSK